MDPKKLEELRAANDRLVELAKTEKRELTAPEKEIFEARNEVLAFHASAPAAATETRSAPPAAPVASIVVAETRSMEKAAAKQDEETEARAIVSALVEKRALAIGSNGDSLFSAKVFEIPGSRTDVVGLVTIEEGAAPNTKFSLFSPNLDQVVRVSEDGTSSAVSTTALVPVVVTPAPYLAYLPLSDSFARQNPAGVVSKIGEHFNKAFLRKMAKEIVIGTGSGEMSGVFINAGITTSANCAAAGAPKLKDLLTLTAKMSGKFLRSELAIIINPLFWNTIMGEDTTHSYINNNSDCFTFNGVRIIEDDNAPVVLTATSKVAVIGNFSDYGIARSQTLEIENIGKVAGSLNSNIQGVAYFDGKPIVPASFATLKTV